MRRATIIIPNENILNASLYCKEIKEEEFHGLGVKIFSNRNKLGITAESLGLEEDEYPGYVWQARLVSMGHAVVCVGDCEPLVAYLPSTISLGQYNWFLDNKKFFDDRKQNFSYIVFDEFETILEEANSNTSLNIVDLLYVCLNSRKILENEESDDLKL